MIKHIKTLIKFLPVFSVITLTPLLALAQTPTSTCADGLTGVICKINDLFSSLLPFLVSLGVIYFIFGVVQYFIGDSDEAKTKGKDRIIYGLIGLVVIVSLWGLVYVVVDTFGLGKNNAAQDVSNLIVVAPSVSGCGAIGEGSKFSEVLNYFTCIIGQSVIPFIFALAIMLFIWGAVKFFIIDAGEEEKRAQGRQFMLWGIIALAVMISVWGLVSMLGATFGIKKSVLPTVSPK